MAKWESLGDGVLVYGRGTPNELKLEGWVEVTERLNQIERERNELRDFAEEVGSDTCPDCGGSGLLGKNAKGQTIACEMCGGNADSKGRGWVTKDFEFSSLRARLAEEKRERDAAMEALRLIEREMRIRKKMEPNNV